MKQSIQKMSHGFRIRSFKKIWIKKISSVRFLPVLLASYGNVLKVMYAFFKSIFSSILIFFKKNHHICVNRKIIFLSIFYSFQRFSAYIFNCFQRLKTLLYFYLTVSLTDSRERFYASKILTTNVCWQLFVIDHKTTLYFHWLLTIWMKLHFSFFKYCSTLLSEW